MDHPRSTHPSWQQQQQQPYSDDPYDQAPPLLLPQLESLAYDTAGIKNLDPALESATFAPVFPSTAWEHSSMQRFLDDPQRLRLFNAGTPMLSDVPDLGYVRPPVTPILPTSSFQGRHSSPVSSSHGPSSSVSSARSPPAESEFCTDNSPATPRDLALFSPVQAMLYDPYDNGSADTYRFAGLGAPYIIDKCVAPADVNPHQDHPLEYSFDAVDDADTHPFDPLQRALSFGSDTSSSSSTADLSAGGDVAVNNNNNHHHHNNAAAATNTTTTTNSSSSSSAVRFARNIPVVRLSSPEDSTPVLDVIHIQTTPMKSGLSVYPDPDPEEEDEEEEREDEDEVEDSIVAAQGAYAEAEDDEDYHPAGRKTRRHHHHHHHHAASSSAPRQKPAAAAASLRGKRPAAAAATARLGRPPVKRQRSAAYGSSGNTLSVPAFPAASSAQHVQPPRMMPSSSGAAAAAAAAAANGWRCGECKKVFSDETGLQAHVRKTHTRPFVCIFNFAGCDATFASKNEWKRHVSSQHLLLHYWRCRESGCNGDGTAPPQLLQPASVGGAAGGSSAVFNRKDLYTQHVRRMHTPPEIKAALKQQEAQSRTVVAVASKRKGRRGGGAGAGPSSSSSPSAGGAATSPAMTARINEWEARVRQLQDDAQQNRCELPRRMECPAPGCGDVFEGADAWDQRMEHVAKHLERHSARSISHSSMVIGPGSAGGKKGKKGKQQQHREEQLRLDDDDDGDDGEDRDLIVFGGDGDPTLMDWVTRTDVDIVRWDAAESRWVLNKPVLTKTTGRTMAVPAQAPVAPPSTATTTTRSSSLFSTTWQQQQHHHHHGRGVADDDDEEEDDDDDEDEDDDDDVGNDMGAGYQGGVVHVRQNLLGDDDGDDFDADFEVDTGVLG